MNNGLRIKDGQYEYITYRTEVHSSYEDAAEELIIHLADLRGKAVWFRQAPEIVSDYDFDTKERIFCGITRYAILDTEQNASQSP